MFSFLLPPWIVFGKCHSIGSWIVLNSIETTFENKIVGLQNAASVLKTEINTAQHNMELLLEVTTRATKDERTALATSSLQTLKKMEMFLKKVVNSTYPLYK